MVVVNAEEFRRLPGAIAIHRAGQALMLGQVADASRHARRVLELAPQDDYLGRGGATALLGIAFWTSGELATAGQLYAEGMRLLQRAGNISDVLGCALALPPPGTNTTLVVVATDATLTRNELARLTHHAHNGLAIAVRPSHTRHDGDMAFALSTRRVVAPISLVNNMAVAAVSEAIRNAVRHAATADGIPGLAG